MEVSIEEKENFTRTMSVRIPAERVDELINQELAKLSNQVQLPGFRPGKTPIKLVESRYRDHINGVVIELLMQESYGKAMVDNQVNPADQPKMELGKVARGTDFTYTATYEQIPEISPTVYKDFKLTRTEAIIEDSDIDKVIEQIRDQNTDFKAEADRIAQSGDQMKFDFDGSIDGVPFAGGKASGHELVLGSGQFIPGFEDQLIGAKAGSDIDVTVSFPEGYQAAHLAGKEAVFKCHVHENRAPVKPEINDDLAVKAGIAEGGMEKLRQEIANRLQSEAKTRSDNEIKKDLLDQLLEANPIEIPQGLVEREQQAMVEQLKQEYKRQGIDAAMLGISDEEMGKGFSTEASKRVKIGMLLGAVARQESLQASEEGVEAFLDNMTASYGAQAGAMRKWMKENPERMDGIRSTVLEATIVDWIVNNSTVEEKTCSLDELMSNKEQ
ncbi:MAG: trigger factor [Magnetococcales bacterium]|nr:trigger factor [Magnetococcales bacterium]